MAVRLKLSSLEEKQREVISNELTVTSNADAFGYSKAISIYAYNIIDDIIYLPFNYCNQKFKKYYNDLNVYSKRNLKLNNSKQLRDYQVESLTKAFERLNKVRTTFLKLPTGKGKTFLTVCITSKIGLKTLVFLHRVNLFEQWEKSILDVIPTAKIQTLDSRCPIDTDCDYYLINPINILKRDPNEFNDIGVLVVDEAHAYCAEKYSKSILWVCPKFCIGLSATPEKSNGLDKILDLHFGADRIEVPLYVEHNYYTYKTKLVPPVKKNYRGDTDWNSVLEFQATNVERNQLIVKMCQMFSDRDILVLCKRKNHTLALFEMFKEEKESVDYIIGTKKKFNKDCRILISTYSKSGVGFDHPKLNMLIIASDVEELFTQYFGRVIRRPDSNPIVIDLVDNYPSLVRHHGTRKSYCVSIGGKAMDFELAFPEFNKPPVIEFVD